MTYHHNHKKQTMGGNLSIVGCDKLKIALRHGHPEIVIVEFTDDPNPVPCNPHQDELEWDLCQEEGGFVLIIKWNVALLRDIVWEVTFK